MQAELSYSQIGTVPVRGYPFGMELQIHIRELRQARGMNLADLAGRVGISAPHMSEVERGKKNLNNHLLVRIAEALNVAPEDLISSGEDQELVRFAKRLGRLQPEDRARVEAFADALLQSQADDKPGA